MTSESLNRRQAARIGHDALPDDLKSLVMVLGTGEKMEVSTYDASTVGLGIDAPVTREIMESYPTITLLPKNKRFRMLGQVVFVIDKPDGSARIGVQLNTGKSGEIYRDLLDKAPGVHLN